MDTEGKHKFLQAVLLHSGPIVFPESLRMYGSTTARNMDDAIINITFKMLQRLYVGFIVTIEDVTQRQTSAAKTLSKRKTALGKKKAIKKEVTKLEKQIAFIKSVPDSKNVSAGLSFITNSALYTKKFWEPDPYLVKKIVDVKTFIETIQWPLELSKQERKKYTNIVEIVYFIE